MPSSFRDKARSDVERFLIAQVYFGDEDEDGKSGGFVLAKNVLQELMRLTPN
jgi:hypothetical protein